SSGTHMWVKVLHRRYPGRSYKECLSADLTTRVARLQAAHSRQRLVEPSDERPPSGSGPMAVAGWDGALTFLLAKRTRPARLIYFPVPTLLMSVWARVRTSGSLLVAITRRKAGSLMRPNRAKPTLAAWR